MDQFSETTTTRQLESWHSRGRHPGGTESGEIRGVDPRESPKLIISCKRHEDSKTLKTRPFQDAEQDGNPYT